MKNLKEFSAHQGGSWQPRKRSHADEMKESLYWSPVGDNSSCSPLREILIYKVPKKIPKILDPEKVQHFNPIVWPRLKKELAAIKKAFKAQDIKVHELDSNFFDQSPPNLMFIRDLFFATPWGAIIARPASRVRAGEEKWAQFELAKLGIPVLQMIHGQGTFEGADALWVGKNAVLVGIGNRTNMKGFEQIKNCLSFYKVECVPVQLPREAQHLLGIAQVVDRNLIFLRNQIAGKKLVRIIRNLGFKIVSMPESSEVVSQQAMNIVTVSPRRIIMPSGCPNTKKVFLNNKVEVVAELDISQFICAAGGLACATGIVRRD